MITFKLPGQQEKAPVINATRSGVVPRVVVVGSGFGGLSVARTLADSEVEVLLLDRNNYHGFWPLLYQVATAGLEPDSIAYPVRGIIRDFKNVNFQMAEVKGIDFEQKQLLTADGGEPIPYDYLVLAAGSANNYFGNDDLATNTYGLKDLEEAVELRNQVLSAFEQAVREKDPVRRTALMTFVIVGGGPTGVELTGAFSELIRFVLRKDYPMLDLSEAHIVLAEAGNKVLASFPLSLQNKAKQQLASLGVELKMGAAVKSVEKGKVSFRDGTELAAETVVWAAGVRAAFLSDVLGITLQRAARVPVEPTLNLTDRSEVFIIGDMAHLEGYRKNKKDQPSTYPMIAPVAIQQGERAAKNILAQVRGKSMKSFKYFDKGNMATIGRRAAVLDAFGVRLSGFPAWVAWLMVHLLFLIGFRNRLLVLTNWAYSYFTYDRAARLIRKTTR